MINLIDAISKRLDELFEGEYAVYLDSVKQNLITPCFFIQSVYNSDKNMISDRKYRLHEFDITFIPDEDDESYRSTLAEVSTKLFDNFDGLELDGMIIPSFERRIEIVDDVLHFFTTFKYYVHYERAVEPGMEDLEMVVK